MWRKQTKIGDNRRGHRAQFDRIKAGTAIKGFGGTGDLIFDESIIAVTARKQIDSPDLSLVLTPVYDS